MGKKGHLTFEKRALNIRMGVRQNSTHPSRCTTGYTLKTQHIILIVMFRKYPQRFIHILILLTSAHFHSYVRCSYVYFLKTYHLRYRVISFFIPQTFPSQKCSTVKIFRFLCISFFPPNFQICDVMRLVLTHK